MERSYNGIEKENRKYCEKMKVKKFPFVHMYIVRVLLNAVSSLILCLNEAKNTCRR